MVTRELDLLSLLDRGPIPVHADWGYLRDRKVMVTGAGGSIGSELCRQIYRYTPDVIMVDRDESALHATQLSIHGYSTLDDLRVVLADVQNRAGIHRMMERYRPEVVFHAAAFKHQPLLERYPDEAVRNNVWGTANVLSAAVEYDVGTFVNISTDKAVNPSCVLGRSKRVTERITSWAAEKTGRRFVSVRFGNVLGSRGSVLDNLLEQRRRSIAFSIAGSKVSRYFMLVEEAVGLTIHAGGIGDRGQALVLDMGKPVRIVDIARRLDPQRPITYTGLRSGEKEREELVGRGETAVRSGHPLITCVDVPGLDPVTTEGIDLETCSDLSVRGQLAALVARNGIGD
jgi:FlaA1/EpsC-like NDP-sugar epimerase